MGASAFLKSVDFTAFAVNVKTIAPIQGLYQSGHAIWWYIAPTIINTFLEAYDFSGKKIILFATSGGSGFGNTVKELKPSVAADAVIIEGKLLNGSNSAAELKAWAESMVEP